MFGSKKEKKKANETQVKVSNLPCVHTPNFLSSVENSQPHAQMLEVWDSWSARGRETVVSKDWLDGMPSVLNFADILTAIC